MKPRSNRKTALTPQFIELVPPELDEGVLYVSMVYGCAIHKCCCGCGEKVVTPLSPTDWKLTFDGESISLHPSIGNWSFPCRSHYWIQENQVRWAEQMSDEQIKAGRLADWVAKARYYGQRSAAAAASVAGAKAGGWRARLRKIFGRD
jgi:hypothetical protein